MKIQPKAKYKTVTFMLALFAGVCFLSVNDRVAMTSVGWIVSELGSPFAQAQGAIVGVGEEKLHAFFQEGKKGPAFTDQELGIKGQKITTPEDNAAPQDERTSSATIQGLVIDVRTRQPIAGARVSLERGRAPVDLSPRGKEPSVSVLTNERGRFRLERIESGVYRLTAEKRGYLTSSFHVVELERGKTTTREVVLDPLAKFSGRVLNESNLPVKGARVGMLFDFRRSSVALQRLLSEQGISALTTTTGHEGEFALFVPAEEESATLMALAFGYAPGRLRLLSVRASRARTGILLRLSRGLEAHGRVVDEDGTPIHGATILAHGLDVGEARLGFKELEPRATSSADGRFVLRGLEKKTYKLKVSQANHATCTIPEVEIRSQTANRLSDIVLLPEAEIRGRVADTKDQPVPGARISGVSGEVNSSEAISDDEGAFVLSGFTPGASVILSATAAGHNKANKVVRAPDRDVVLVLPQHGVLRGRVEDAESLAPVKEFHIFGAEGKSFHSEDGTFELADLPPGQWTFVAQAPGYQAARLEGIEIRAGETTEIVIFSLAKGIELTGRVVDAATGVGIPDATVSYRSATELTQPARGFRFGKNSQKTDADGNFKFDGLLPGKVTIIAKSPLHAETWRTVMAGEESFVEIRLTTGGFISGRVVGLDATTLIPEARVTLWSVASKSGITIPADEAGAFYFGHLEVGLYQLTADTKLGPTKPQEIVLRENERVTGLVLVVKAGATIRGNVTGLRPDELPVVEVVAQGQGGFIGDASTSSDGAYAIHGVPEGWVGVTAQTYSQRSISKSVEIRQGILELVLNIEFPRATRLSGRVSQDGKPVAFRVVDALPRNPESAAGSGKTDQNGMYVIDGLSEGDYVVSLSGEGAKSLRISGDTVLDIQLPTLSISGRILEANSGKPLSGVNVQVQRVSPGVNASISRTALTDTLGRFTVEGLEPEQYQLVAHRRGFTVGTEMLSVPASSELVLLLAPAEGIAIRVRDGISGLALRTVTVDAFSDAQRVRMNVALDETGSGELPQLAPRRYNLLVSSWDYAPKSVIGWTVSNSLLDIILTPGGRLEIHVDSAYTGAKASLVDANGIPPLPIQTEFALLQSTVFPHLAPGEYNLLIKLREQTKRYKASIVEGQTTVLQVK